MDEEEDRISSLSDDVLSHILSYLEIREAVETMVLSKRWEKVWTQIHRIHLGRQSYVWEFQQGTGEENNKRRASYINGVLTGIRNNNSINNVTSFCLEYDSAWPALADEIPYLRQWLAAAVTLPNLQKFDCRLLTGQLYILEKLLPLTLFQCPKLETLLLKNSNYNTWDLPKTFCLAGLKKLHLSTVVFNMDCDNSLEKLLSSCPVLEELHLESIIGRNLYDIEQEWFVLSPSLKILRLIYSGCGHYPCSYFVEAPKLEYLQLLDEGGCLERFSMIRPSSLVSAVIDIGKSQNLVPTSSFVAELFQGISGVQKLELSTHETLMRHDFELADLPEFSNLIHLKVGNCRDRRIVPHILQQSPNLKHLILDENHFSSKPYPSRWSPPGRVPKCLTLHLEMIEILSVYEKYNKESMEMILYFLEKGKMLKKMVIFSYPYEKGYMEFIGSFPKASAGCQILFPTPPAGTFVSINGRQISSEWLL